MFKQDKCIQSGHALDPNSTPRIRKHLVKMTTFLTSLQRNKSFPEYRKGYSHFLNLGLEEFSTKQTNQPLYFNKVALTFLLDGSCSVCAAFNCKLRVLKTSLILVSPPFHKLNLCTHDVHPVELIPMICNLMAESPTEYTSRQE